MLDSRPAIRRLVLAAALGLPFPALAADLFVNNEDPTCLGHEPCFASIQAAIDETLPGDRVQIQPGLYFEELLVRDKNAFSGAAPADRIVIGRAADAPLDSVVLMGQGGGCSSAAIRIRDSQYVSISGLIITGFPGSAIALSGGSNDNAAVHVERNRIFRNGGDKCNGGIVIGKGNPGTVVVNNLIYANGGNGIDDEGADDEGDDDGSDDDGADDERDDEGDDERGDGPIEEGEIDLTPHYVIQNTIHANGKDGIVVSEIHEVVVADNAVTDNGKLESRSVQRRRGRQLYSSPPKSGGYGVRRLESPAGTAGITLLNNLLCGNLRGELKGSVLVGSSADNLTPTGSEGPGVLASPECVSPGGVYEDVAGPDGKTQTLDDDFALAGPGAQLPSPAIDRGVDPRTLGLDMADDPLLLADFAAAGARPVQRDANRPLDFDIGALELSCDCFENCELCEIVIDPDGSSSDACALTYNPDTQCCNRINGALSARHLGEAYDVCPDTRSSRVGWNREGNADGCSAVPDNPLALCPSVSFGCDEDAGEPNCPEGIDLPCNQHDFCYQTCNVPRETCDGNFYDDMLAVCDSMTPAQKVLCFDDCVVAASTYYSAVAVFSGTAYENGQNRACQCCQNVFP